MFNQHAKDDNEEKNSFAWITVSHAHSCHAMIFLTSVQQAKASTSF